MLKLILLLLGVGLIAALFGFGGISNLAFGSAQFLIVLLIGLVILGIVAVVAFGRRILG